MINNYTLPFILGAILITGCATSKSVIEPNTVALTKVENENSEIAISIEPDILETDGYPDILLAEDSLTNNDLLPIHPNPATDKHLVQIGRYSAIHPVPTKAQQNILNVMIQVTLPEEIDTIGQATRYLLNRSGYQLAPPTAQGPEILQLLVKKLPEIHRHLGPMTLENALLTLTAPAFRLQKDPVHRLIAFELIPDYMTENN